MPRMTAFRPINLHIGKEDTRAVWEDRIYPTGLDGSDRGNCFVSLSNGGGKSSLLLAIQQAFNPYIKRRIEDGDKQITSPASLLAAPGDEFAIALEFALDDGDASVSQAANRLAFGVVIARTAGTRADTSVDNLGFIGFTWVYSSTDRTAGLARLPFANGTNKLPPFREITTVRKPANFQFYKNRTDYRKALNGLGIDTDLYRAVYHKVGGEESGIERWMQKRLASERDAVKEFIAAVDEREDARTGGEKGASLPEMLCSFARASEKLKGSIDEREDFERALGPMTAYRDAVASLSEADGQATKAVGALQTRGAAIDARIGELENQIAEIDCFVEEAEKEVSKAKYREASTDAAEASEAAHRAERELAEASAKVEAVQQAFDDTQRRLRVLSCSVDLAAAREAANERERGQAELESLRASREENEELARLQWSVKKGYESEREILKARIEELASVRKEAKAALEGARRGQKDARKKAEDAKENAVSYGTRAKMLSDSAVSAYAEAGQHILSSFDGRVDMGTASKALRDVRVLADDAKNAFTAAEKRLSAAKERLASAERGSEEAEREEKACRQDLEEAKSSLDSYKGARAELQKGFLGLGFDAEEFDPPQAKSTLAARQRERQERSFAARKREEAATEELRGLKEGTLHASRELMDYLDKVGVAYQTGVKRLRAMPQDAAERILRAHPAFPYGIVLDAKNLERLEAAEPPFRLPSLVPVYTYDEEGSLASSMGRIRVLASSDFRAILHGDVLIEELKKEIEACGQESAAAETDAVAAASLLSSVESFSAHWNGWRRADLEARAKAVEAVEGRLAKALETRASAQEELLAARETACASDSEREEAREAKEKMAATLKELEKAFGNAEEASRCADERDKWQGAENAAKQEEERNGREAERQQALLRESATELDAARNRIDVISGRLEQVKSAVEKKLLEGSPDALYEVWRDLLNKVVRDEGDLEERIERAHKAEQEALARARTAVGGDATVLAEAERTQAGDTEMEDLAVRERELSKDLEEARKARESAFGEAKVAKDRASRLAQDVEERFGKKPEGRIEDRKVLALYLQAAEAKLSESTRKKSRAVEERDEGVKLKANVKEALGGALLARFFAKREEAASLGTVDDAVWRETMALVSEANRQGRNYVDAMKEVKVQSDVLDAEMARVAALAEIKAANKKRINEFLAADEKAGSETSEKRARSIELMRLDQNARNMVANIQKVIDRRKADLEVFDRRQADFIAHVEQKGIATFNGLLQVERGAYLRVGDGKRPIRLLSFGLPNSEVVKDNRAMRESLASYIKSCAERLAGKDEKTRRQEAAACMSSFRILDEMMKGCARAGSWYHLRKLEAESLGRGARLVDWGDSASGGQNGLTAAVCLIAYVRYLCGKVGESGKGTFMLALDNPYGNMSSENLLDPFFDFLGQVGIQLFSAADHRPSSVERNNDAIVSMKGIEYANGRKRLAVDGAYSSPIVESLVYRTRTIEQESLF